MHASTPVLASPPGPRQSQRGFTIMEVTMTTFIMAFGIATAILTMMSGFRSIDVARNMTLASQVLQSEMERVRLMSWSDIGTLPAKETVDLSSVFTSDPALANRYSLVRAVTDVTGKTGEMKEILLVVSWENADGRSLSRQFRTYYTKDGLYDYYYTLARS
jgi:type II secretory pathway pseudopilin PulG